MKNIISAFCMILITTLILSLLPVHSNAQTIVQYHFKATNENRVLPNMPPANDNYIPSSNYPSPNGICNIYLREDEPEPKKTEPIDLFDLMKLWADYILWYLYELYEIN